MVSFQKRYRENVKLQTVLKWVVDVIVILCAAYILVSYTCTRVSVSGNSMNTVLENDDIVLINKMKYTFVGPARFDIIAFEPAGITSSKVYVKRVIALPGETVQIKNGKVYINDAVLEDDVIKDNIVTAGLASVPIVLGEDEYFVMGDNRNNSEDSRFAHIGKVKRADIIGAPWLVISPFRNFKLL